jgi:hypothetical protein
MRGEAHDGADLAHDEGVVHGQAVHVINAQLLELV